MSDERSLQAVSPVSRPYTFMLFAGAGFFGIGVLTISNLFDFGAIVMNVGIGLLGVAAGDALFRRNMRFAGRFVEGLGWLWTVGPILQAARVALARYF